MQLQHKRLIKAFIFLDCCGLIFTATIETSFAFGEKELQSGISCYLHLIECIKHKKILSRTNRKEPNTVRNKIEQQKIPQKTDTQKVANIPLYIWFRTALGSLVS